MKFIAIVKTAGELEVKDDAQKNLPNLYPVECKEFEAETFEEAQSLYPDKKVMSVEQYNNGYSQALDDIFNEAQATQVKPWWKLW